MNHRVLLLLLLLPGVAVVVM